MAVIWILSGLMAGLLGGAVWAGVSHWTGYEVGYLAWGVGALVGFAVGSAAKQKAGVITALAACVFAVGGIAVGKYGGLWLDIDAVIRQTRDEPISDELLTTYIADQVIIDRQAQGQEVVWPEGVDALETDAQTDYPADVWAEAERQWAAMTASERATFRRTVTETAAQELKDLPLASMIVSTISVHDILWLGLAIISAFRLGLGSLSAGQQPAANRLAQVEAPTGGWLSRAGPANAGPRQASAPKPPVPNAPTPIGSSPSAGDRGGPSGFSGIRGLPNIPEAASKPAEKAPVFRPDRMAS
jgi:uncharacterized membrane protein (Fun14 family)